MAEVDPELRRLWRAKPTEPVELILHVEGDLEARQAALQEQGVQVRRRFALTRALSVRCDGQTALRLAKLAWVKRIEPDRPVKALGR
jgi:hypothetical protein